MNVPRNLGKIWGRNFFYSTQIGAESTEAPYHMHISQKVQLRSLGYVCVICTA